MWETGSEVRRKQVEQAARRSRARPGAQGRGRSLTLAVTSLLVLVAGFNLAVIHLYHSNSVRAGTAAGAGAAVGAAAGASGTAAPLDALPGRREAREQAQHARAHALALAAAEGNATAARTSTWASWADLSQQITDMYAGVLGSEMVPVLRAALLEISPASAQAQHAAGGGAPRKHVAEDCYAGSHAGQVPWWLVRHDTLVELPATRGCAAHAVLWRATHGHLRAVGAGGATRMHGLRACAEGPGGTPSGLCLRQERLYMCMPMQEDGPGGGSGGADAACLDTSLARLWCATVGGELCGGVSLVAGMLASAAVSVATLGSTLEVKVAKDQIALPPRAMPGLAANISADVRALGADVSALYSAILRRDADAGGLAAYANHLVAGRLVLPQVAQALRDSPEFRSRLEPGGTGLFTFVGGGAGRAELLRTLAALVALQPGCKGEGGAAGEAAAARIMGGAVDKPPLVCDASQGVPLEMYQRLLTMHLGALPLADPMGAAATRPDELALRAADEVIGAYQTYLGRWPSRNDIAGRMPGLLAGTVTAATLAAELLRSGERRQLISTTSPVTGGSASLAAARGVVQGLLLKYCAGPACPSQAAVRAETRVDALQRLWNRHAPVLTKDGGVTFDFARERERLGGFVPIGMYVYNRPHYLRQVLANLRSARGVEHVLLVVSLDATRQEMVDEVLRAAEFVAGVRLLLHPYPEPLFGAVGGRGADGVLVVKMHWRFLLRQLWEEQPDLRGYDGEVLLLEEDHAPTPDVLETLRALVLIKNGGQVDRGLRQLGGAEGRGPGGQAGVGACEGCWGVYLKFGCMEESKESDVHKACRVKWFVNTGLAFNRSIYAAIVRSDFDAFRDGWDWSMYHLIQTQQLLPCQVDGLEGERH